MEREDPKDYLVLMDEDIHLDPPEWQPLRSGDLFDEVDLKHLASPIKGPVMVVGHPCSLRTGQELRDDIPVAPVEAEGIPTAELPHTHKFLPLPKSLPLPSAKHERVDLTALTTIPHTRLDYSARYASLSRNGVIALHQRLVGNLTRVRVEPGKLREYMRGPMAEMELWTDWRERCVEEGLAAEHHDSEFETFLRAECRPGMTRRAHLDTEGGESAVTIQMEDRLDEIFP